MGKAKENRLVVADKGWAETAPEWLREEVKFERLAHGLASITSPTDNKVGDAEACFYLYTLSLRQAMGPELTNAYIYLGAKLMKRRKGGKPLPEFMEEALRRGLTEYEQRELDDLKRTLYQKRGGEISHPLLDAMRQLKREIFPAVSKKKQQAPALGELVQGTPEKPKGEAEA